MTLADIDFTNLVSFWGGIASIVTICVTASVLVWKTIRKRIDAYIEKLNGALKQITARASAATTQGRRMDLFAYQQSIFSSLRFELVMTEIGYWSIHTIVILAVIQ